MSPADTDYDRVLDVRDIDGEPFSEIIEAVAALGDDERLLLINSFEPVPLYDVLSDRGLEYDTTQAAQTEWRVEIFHV